ncbi:MAG: MBL fold metallo-hydrolase [Dysgonamonadaceae bacterium]|nr:MBL fold metallo-hydrolase [Dysgonamonadaceae bacterium]MDD4728827.1 MBL fold metallo-hydrolase [Dysgonamonadaceae bacterium]
MQYNLFSSNQYTFFCLSSGSCGNCYFIGNGDYGILIDVGIGVRTIRKRLKEHGYDLPNIRSILITHDHLDHIKSVGTFARRYSIPVYATKKVHHAISVNRFVKEDIGASRRIIEKGQPFQIEDFRFTAFDVPHDSHDNSGYFIEFGTHKMTLATDIGKLTDEMTPYLTKAHHLIIESNYDEEMLRNGRYPYHLKQRITSGLGHISNRQTGEFLAENCKNHVRNIWLCHLSSDNNSPEVAYETVKKHLIDKGMVIDEKLQLHVLERNKLSPLMKF